jgi:GNAT superfamily N-acetyltransferase
MQLSLLERDTYAFFAGFARRPGGEWGEEGGARWFRSGVPSITYNGVLGVGTEVVSTINRVRAWGTPAWWILNSAFTPPSFERQLSDRGLTLFGEMPGMVSPVHDLPNLDTNGLTLEAVRADSQFTEWADVFRDAFGLAPEAAHNMRSAHEWSCFHDERRRYFLLHLDGEAVATGLLHSSPGVAGVYGVAVRRAYQKRGFGKLATLLTVREAGSDAQLAVLQATAEGRPVYERLGFQTLCVFKTWRIA